MDSKPVLLDNLKRGLSTGSPATRLNPWGGVRESEEATRLSKVFSAIQQRCSNPKNRAYKHYGAKGIFLCPSLSKFWEFFDYVTGLPGYDEGMELDRIDTSKGYEKGNLQWLDKLSHMRKDGIWNPVEFRGTVYASFKDFWRENVKEISYGFARKRYCSGASLEELVAAKKWRTWTKAKTKQTDRMGFVKRVRDAPICSEVSDDYWVDE